MVTVTRYHPDFPTSHPHYRFHLSFVPPPSSTPRQRLPLCPLRAPTLHPLSMLDRLPTELLLRTLQLLAPLDYSASYYKQRRIDLRNCCLVSKTMSALAKPMLPEVYEVASHMGSREINAPRLSTSVETLRWKRVRLLVLRQLSRSVENERLLLACCWCHRSPYLASRGVCDGPALEVAQYVPSIHFRAVFVSLMSATVDLRHLLISGYPTTLRPSSATAIFPSLCELSLTGVDLEDDFFHFFLTPSSAPSLRSLTLVNNVKPGTLAFVGFPALDQDLLARLDVLLLSRLDSSPPASHLRPLVRPGALLVDFPFFAGFSPRFPFSSALPPPSCASKLRAGIERSTWRSGIC